MRVGAVLASRRLGATRMAALWERETASINLGKGHPKPTLLDLQAVTDALVDAGQTAGAPVAMMNYGSGKGPKEMCSAVADWMYKWGRRKALSPERIMVTAGASAALDMVCAAFSSPGDTVVVEQPSYFLSYGVLRERGLRIVEVGTDSLGLDVDALETQLESGLRPALLYTIPICNNPRGTSLDAARAAKLVELSRKYEFKIAADEVYFFLQFSPTQARSLAEEDDEENPTVLCMHSMSKTLGPGTRVGWIDANPKLVARVLQHGATVSGGCMSHFMAAVVGRLISSGREEPLLANFRKSYEDGARALTSALDTHLPAALGGRPFRYDPPAGGYFVWVELPEAIDANRLLRLAEDKHGVFFFAGTAFCVDGKSFQNCLRLCFAMLEPEQIEEGVRRLAAAIEEYLQAEP